MIYVRLPLRWWPWLLGLVLPASCAAPTRPAPAYRIGFSQCTTRDAGRRAMLAGMVKELSFYPNVQFWMLDPHSNSDCKCAS